MKTIKIFKLSSFFLFILIAAQSCMVSSLNPLYTHKDRILNDRIEGEWIDSDKNNYKITLLTEPRLIKFRDGFPARLDNAIENELVDSAKLTKDPESIKRLYESFNKMEKLAKYSFYQIKMSHENKITIFEGRLSKLGDNYFLDIIPNDDNIESKLDDDYMIGLVAPMHGFIKVQFLADSKIKLNWMDSEAFKSLRKSKKVRIKSQRRNDREIITARTSAIQKFLIKFADSELFNNKDAELILTPLK
tara:strand:+ start:3272 stop:4012 length:741 start_codon:yes stop_codon:yes gene_type:complete